MEQERRRSGTLERRDVGGETAEQQKVRNALMPLVKAADKLVADGKVGEGAAMYQQAVDGFTAAGMKRPKLKEKLDAAKGSLIIAHHRDASAAAGKKPARRPSQQNACCAAPAKK